jgi:taurine dioxygenase
MAPTSSRLSTDLTYQPLGQTFGARVLGADLTTPLSPAQRGDVAGALHRFRVLLFRGQQLTVDEIVAFGGVFGTLENQSGDDALRPYLLPGHPEVLVISNIFRDGRPIGYYNDDNEEWHADYSWAHARMDVGAMLYGVEAPPEGGATLFVDATTAYDELPEPIKASIADLHAIHSLSYLHERQHAQTPDAPDRTGIRHSELAEVVHPLVRRHPVTGRRSLLLGTMEIRRIVEIQDGGRTLLDDLTTHVAQPRYRYRHEWQVGDLVVWDNRAVLHAATYCDRLRFRRKLYRTTIQ